MTADAHWLVGDIGGTNARFALVDVDGPPREARKLPRQSFNSVAEAIEDYLQGTGAPRPAGVALAAAGPVIDGAVRFTNRGWSTSETALRGLGFDKAIVVNDFAALAQAAPTLGPADFRVVGPPIEGDPASTVAVLGPGTGFGVGALARRGGQTLPIWGEGGHVGFAPADDVEIEIARRLALRHGRVSWERILSGPGLAALHDLLAEIDGRPAPGLAADEITRRALARDPACDVTLDRFCAILGSAAGDFAMAFGARGGVWLTGGVAQAAAPLLEASPFRARFEDKGRMSAYVAAIPTRLIVDSLAALRGLAVMVQSTNARSIT